MRTECIRTESAHRHIIDDGTRILVLVELQIGVNQIVLPVHLITGRLVRFGRLHGGNVGRHRVFSESDASEDVGWHMLRMRCSRRDFGVASGGVDPFLGERRRIIEVNKIMSCSTRVLRLPLVDRLQGISAVPSS